MSDVSSRQQTPDVQPAIAELLRTCVYPPVLPLQIDHVVRKSIQNGDSEDGTCHGYATKLFLTDGELVIQALLHRKLSTLPEIEDLDVGDIVEIHDFVVRKAKRKNGLGHVVYLGVENCYVIKKETGGMRTRVEIGEPVGETYTTSRERLNSDFDGQGYEDEDAGGFFRDEPTVPAYTIDEGAHSFRTELPNQLIQHEPALAGSALSTPRSSRSKKRKIVKVMADSDESEDFETASINMNTAKRRRQALRELDRNVIPSPNGTPSKEHIPPINTVISESEEQLTGQGLRSVIGRSAAAEQFHVSVTDTTTIVQTMPGQRVYPASQPDPWGPFQHLASLYSSSLPAKSYVLTTLIVPTYVSSHLISRPNSPLPAKRHVKIIDVSLASKLNISGGNLKARGITVSVFRDALDFKPVIGHVALLRGLVMQRLKNGEVILNVYPEKSRIQRQSQTRSQSQVADGSRPPSRHAHFADDPAVAPVKWETEAKNLIQRRDQVDQLLKSDHLVKEAELDSAWFIDDHVKLRALGYDVDGMQQWWNRNVNK